MSALQREGVQGQEDLEAISPESSALRLHALSGKGLATNFAERQLRDCLKKMSAAGYALLYGEQKIPYGPLRRRVGAARDIPPGL